MSEPGAEACFCFPEGESIASDATGRGQRHIDLRRDPGSGEGDSSDRRTRRRLTPERAMEFGAMPSREKLPAAIVRAERGPFSYMAGEPLGDFRISFDRAVGRMRLSRISGRHTGCASRSAFSKAKGSCNASRAIIRTIFRAGRRRSLITTAKCRDCHASVSAAGHASDGDCVSCHMPKRRTDDEVHVVMTDHYIQRKLPGGLGLAEQTETHRDKFPETAVHRGEVVLYYPAKLPDTPENALALAVAQIHDGSNLGIGLPRLTALLEKHRPANASYYADLAEGYLAAGDSAKAIHYFEEAVQRSRAPVSLLRSLGSALLEARQFVKAEEVLRRATSLAPDDSPAWGMLGWALLQQNKTAEARTALEKAVRLDPELPEPHSNLASLLAGTGDTAGAEKEFREAIRILPGIAEWQSNLGGLLSDRGQLLEARYHFAQAVRLKPDDPVAHLEYGRLLAATGDRSRAVEHFRIASMGADVQAKNEARELLQRLGR